ncbi:MAG: hypothetical protein EA393_09520 [Bacteroidetes bacterium]|nr:MAG: hypothetical protein EA393_09520 [Bacteroidota bacterium]
MGWKDYFYFTKTERNGIVVLSVLLIIIIILPFFYPILFPAKVYDFTEFNDKIEKYEKLRAEYHEARIALEKTRIAEQTIKPELVLTLAAFNPNLLNREEFVEMGFPERIAGNIVNYRNAGGIFRFREDLKRIFSIDEDFYSRIENYIDLPSREEHERTRREELQARALARDTLPDNRRQPSWASVLIDINKADTTEWQQIRGIGPVFSRRIASYRDLLGGFYSTEQLMEVYGMDSSRFEQILPHVFISDSIELRRIDINTADFATLIRHPYLDRNQVNSILRMRELHGKYTSLNDILRSELIDDSVFQRVAPYLVVYP